MALYSRAPPESDSLSQTQSPFHTRKLLGRCVTVRLRALRYTGERECPRTNRWFVHTTPMAEREFRSDRLSCKAGLRERCERQLRCSFYLRRSDSDFANIGLHWNLDC